MGIRRVLSIIAVGGALATSAAIVASPANAATLPAKSAGNTVASVTPRTSSGVVGPFGSESLCEYVRANWPYDTSQCFYSLTLPGGSGWYFIWVNA